MYKNQLQELAQRSCFNLPSYSCIREGPDHAPRFRATVNFNGETFESPSFCSTLRLAEHAAAEVALNALANRGPSKALAAKVLDETGVYKNLLQETAHRAGINLPTYTTVRCGSGHVPVFSCTVELAGLSFSGEPAKTKKQAQKNAAIAGWSKLKQMAQCDSSSSSITSSSSESEGSEDKEKVVIARFLANLRPTDVKVSTHNDQLDGAQKPRRHAFGDLNSEVPSSYPIQNEAWVYSSISPQMDMYRVWQQTQLSHLPFPPPVTTRQVLPVMPSYYSLDQIYFPRNIAPLRPPFYFPAPSFPAQIRGGSMVKIQEIHEEKAEGSLSETSGRASSQPNPMRSDLHGTVQVETSSGHFASVSPNNVKIGIQPHEGNGLHYPPREGLSQVSATAPIRIGGHIPSPWARPPNSSHRAAAPPYLKSGATLIPCSSKPRTRSGLPPRFMAPSVQIRSVVPVCSAPPARTPPTSSLERESPGKERIEQEGLSTVGSELNKLHM